jgi:hypothetical protein
MPPARFVRIVLTLAAMGVMAAVPARAAEEARQRMVYDVYASGLHALRAEMDMDLRKKGRYDLVLDTKTYGLLAALVPWEGRFESHGWRLKKDVLRPEQHKSTAQWRKEIDIKDYRYRKDGRFVSLEVFDENGKVEDREARPEVTDGTVDTLTAALSVFEIVGKTGRCEGASDVFDGKRRFRQAFTDEGEETLQASQYNIYAGKARKCAVEVTPLAGDWGNKPRGWLSIQEQGRVRGTMPTVWIARLSPAGPPVPVRIMVKTAYGTLFMHLAEYQNGSTLLVAQDRHEESPENKPENKPEQKEPAR